MFSRSVFFSVIISLTMPGAASAMSVSFDDTERVTASALNAVVSNNSVAATYSGGSYGGNSVDLGSVSGGFGTIIAINQNSAPNANTQQAVTVSIGDIHVPEALAGLVAGVK